MVNWDTSFVRDGKGIADWLPQLVSEDSSTRRAAAEALGGMWHAKPAYGTRWEEVLAPGDGTQRGPDLAAQASRFAQAVRDAVAEPGFPRAAFVRRLLLYRMALKRDWLERVARATMNDERLDARETRLIEQALTSSDPAERQRAIRRFGQMFCAALARDNRMFDASESMQAPGMVAFGVYQALDTALLEAPDLLHEMLDDRYTRSYAIEGLQRMGSAAAPFAKRLFRELDASTDRDRFDGDRVLGNIAGADGETAAALVTRLRGENDAVWAGAAASLDHAGPTLPAALKDDAITLLRRGLVVPERWMSALPALASVGRDRADVLDDVLAFAAPRPPRMRQAQHGKYTHEYDEVMYERGVGIEAVRHFTAFPDRVVHVLVEAIESFKEYDPDWEYDRAEHGRVADSLRAFGAAAGELAAPVLAGHLRQSNGEVDWEVIRLLGDIGPSARAALPVLEALAAELDPPDGPLDQPGARQWDPANWAVWRIKSQESGA